MNFMLLILAAPQRLGKSGHSTLDQQRKLYGGMTPRILLQAQAAVAQVKWQADRLERLPPLAASSCAWFARLQIGPEHNLPPVRTRRAPPSCAAASIAALCAALTNTRLLAGGALDAVSAGLVGTVFSVSP